MPQHSLGHLHRSIVLFCIFFLTGAFVPTVIAILCEKVTPYVPYISEGAGTNPESGIFTVSIVIASLFNLFIMGIRFLYIEEVTYHTRNPTHLFMNRLSLFIGVLSVLSLTVAVAFPTTTITQVHNTSAGGASICLVLYMFLHAWLSLWLFPDRRISKIRLVIVVLSVIAIVFTAVFGLLGSFHWSAAHWVGSKTPKDQGFLYYVISSSSEWILILLFVVFVSTFFYDFKNMVFHFRLESVSAQASMVPPKIMVTRG